LSRWLIWMFCWKGSKASDAICIIDGPRCVGLSVLTPTCSLSSSGCAPGSCARSGPWSASSLGAYGSILTWF
jgi:hypothetical protein